MGVDGNSGSSPEKASKEQQSESASILNSLFGMLFRRRYVIFAGFGVFVTTLCEQFSIWKMNTKCVLSLMSPGSASFGAKSMLGIVGVFIMSLLGDCIISHAVAEIKW